MTLTAFFLVLLSALLHAWWNFLCKSKRPSPAFVLVMNIAGTLASLPFFYWAEIPWDALPKFFWGMLVFSIGAEALYSISLSIAYRHGDISLAYPLSRSLPVLLTAAATITLNLGKRPGLWGLTGLGVLFLGCLLIPQRSFRDISIKNYRTPALIPILCAAVGTTCYTIADSVAPGFVFPLSESPQIVILGVYFCMVQLGISVTIAFCFFFAPQEYRAELKPALCSFYPYLAGVFSFAAYFLVLIAMRHVTNVSFVQALRQLGLPLGVFAGVYFLKEKLTWVKAIGIVLIVGGLAIASFAR